MHFEQRFGAREIKFLVSPARAEQIRTWARGRLAPDPNAGSGGDMYRVTSLYFDTACFDVFHARGSYGRAKYRVRRYGDASTVFAERKMRTQTLVSKRRVLVGLDEVPRMGGWFQRRIEARRLNPVCCITYMRTALVDRQIRLTLDDQLCAARTDAFMLGELNDGIRIATSQQILELKYLGEMPALFKELLETFPLNRTPLSKYRTAAAELGLAAKQHA